MKRKGQIILVTMLAVFFMASTVYAQGSWWDHGAKQIWKAVWKLEKKVAKVDYRSKKNSSAIKKLKKKTWRNHNKANSTNSAPTPAVDVAALKAEIIAELKADDNFISELKGEKGDPGDPGEKGEDGASATFMSHWESFTTYNGDNLKLAGVNLKDARILESYFHDADLSDANLAGAHLDGSFFSSMNSVTSLAGANLTNASVAGADFTGCDFTDAVLTGVDLNTARSVAGAIWNNTTCPDGSNSDDNGQTCEGHFSP